MSSIGRFAYKNYIYHMKYIGWSNTTGDYEYADPVLIKGYYSSINKSVVDSQGVEFIPKFTFMTEYGGDISAGDLIAFAGLDAKSIMDADKAIYEEVRVVDFFNSTPFNEKIMDWRAVT